VGGVGIRSAFAALRSSITGSVATASGAIAGRIGIRSPWSTSNLQAAVLADVFGTDALPVSRTEAMSIPAVAKARHLVCTVLPNYPLVEYEGEAVTSDQPSWLASTTSQTSPLSRLLWTLDDLYFGGWALWSVDREDAEPGVLGEIRDAVRVPPEMWNFENVTGTTRILVDGTPAEEGEVILFPGPFEGMCEVASRTMRGAVAIERAWVGRAESPIPAIDIHQTDDVQLDDDEIDDLLDEWSAARRDPRGAIGYSPNNIEIRALGTVDPQLFVEGRNAIRLDIANFSNVPASYLEGSLSTASLTYSTADGNRNELLDLGLGMWRSAIESRLSMDDVSPPGRRIAFDLTALTELPHSGIAPARED
jgi:hypothetical protein